MFNKVAIITIAIVLLSACGHQRHYAPVSNKDSAAKYTIYGHQKTRPKEHRVREGDTLYSIAWQNKITVSQLASANNLRPPYRIYPGQLLSLSTTVSAASKKASSIKPKSLPSQPQANKNKQNTKVGTKSASNKKTNKKRQKRQSVDNDSSLTSSSSTWYWPAKGKIITHYSATGSIHKGIDFSGKLGDAVLATQAGQVVYAGSGLIGYGKLIILKHGNNYLSAYAHNNRIIVKEGEQVKARQKIAEIGKTGTNRFKLHFEIRRDGKSVDPLKYLSKKR